MVEACPQSTADILERATVALRGEQVSGAAPPHIITATVVALAPAASREILQPEHQTRRVFRITYYGGLASVAALLAM
ncbi:MAG TPA: hypothetical protein VFW73_13065, partial [Lacipirellulaceae bacterium]|nr:hypothetical protein [Lacipirellulaceae bacterium]